MRKIIFTMIFVVSLSFIAQALGKASSTNSPIPPVFVKFYPPEVVAPEMIKFFAGDWRGAGEFENGRKIEADVSFAPELDNYRLSYRHTDRAPNKYKALGTWGYDRETDKFVMFVQDNSGGSRIFESDGWAENKVVFTRNAVASTGAKYAERFTFERTGNDAFTMTYETNRDGANWKLGDYLNFKRK